VSALFDLSQRFVGEVAELPGGKHSPFIQWCHECCGLGFDQPDETPWCSSFVNRMAWMLRLPRSKSAAARSWLAIGTPVQLTAARVGDVVILKRGDGGQPGPEVTSGAPGHVGLFAGFEGLSAVKPGQPAKAVRVLGGNQSDSVTIASFPVARVLGVRRLG
jgi:uncharacterized protein (TIGR02594 family)